MSHLLRTRSDCSSPTSLAAQPSAPMADRSTDPPTPTYYLNVFGGVGGAGGISERGTGGNGGLGQGPMFNVRTTHFTVHNVSTEALEKLGYVATADIDAQSPERCLKGTRVGLLNDLRAWALSRDPNSPRIFWLDGMAGTGKSAIARSFCHMLSQDNRLGGSFFCLRGDANRGNPKHILPTLAARLASRDVTYKGALLPALNEGISSDANLEIQVENLIEKPLRSARSDGMSIFVLVIDALDELDDEDATKELLRRLVAVVPRLPIKLFVTSRPERHIRPHFNTQADLHRVLRLHDIENDIVKADISLYLTDRLAGIRAESSPMLPFGWASPTDIEALTDRAGKLFSYAFTAVKYIGENPIDRLRTLISMKVDRKGPLTKPLDEIYGRILRDAVDTDKRESDEIGLTKRILAAILTVGQPISVASLGGLLGVPVGQVRAMLDRLHAVIHVPVDDDLGVLSTFHASFGDFLTTAGRVSDEMLINPAAAHAALFSDCIRVMGSKLQFNVSNCSTSYFPNIDHKFTIPPLLQYVCLFWPRHIAAASAGDQASVTSSHLDSLKDVFLPKFLFWVEVLSAMNKASVASNLIMTALTTKCFVRAPLYLTEFLRDANEFVVSSLEAIETSVAHIYLSALPCLRPTSKVAQAFRSKYNCLPLLHLIGIQRRQEATLILKSQAAVQCIAVSADGAHIVSGSLDNTICVWDARTGEAVMEPIVGHTDWLTSVVFSPNGAHIMSGSSDKTIRMWDTRTGKAVIEPIQSHTDEVMSVAFSPDGSRIVAGLLDGRIHVWDARTGSGVLEPIQGHTSWVSSVVFSPDGARIVSGSSDHTIRVWNARTGKAAMGPIQGHTGRIFSVGFTPDGGRILSGSSDNTIRVWDAKTGKAIRDPIQGYTDQISSVMVSPDGTQIVSGSTDGTIRLWNVKTGREVIAPIRGHTGWVKSVMFSPDGSHIVSGSGDKTIRVWEVRADEAVAEPIQGHTDWVSSVAFSPDGTHIASGSSDQTIHVWDSRMGKAVMEPIRGHKGQVLSVAFSPGGSHIASGSSDKTIRVWDARTGKTGMKPIRGHTDQVSSVTFSPDGSRIVSGSRDKTIRVWVTKTGKTAIKPIRGHTDQVLSVAFSPDGARIASGSSDQTIRVWDARTGEAIMGPIQGHTSQVLSVAFSPDGAHIVSGSSDKTIRVWDARTGKTGMKPIQGHTDHVSSVVFSPNGAHIVSGSRDNTIRVWDSRIGKAVMEPILGHTDWVTSVIFSPDGMRIVSGSDDKTIRAWNAMTGVPTVDNFTSATDDFSIGAVTLPHGQDSWIRGPRNQLVMWVPPEYRSFLQLEPTFVASASPRVIVDMGHLVQGTDWGKCWNL
ncbi:quinon protein alcohol dehydrogenase-like superfamily [Mycena galopus ATCC 62051]|nr:quinon protein alcohol dehydrogenase-like superfamily [Mycena galopus ATCC 62051]